MPHLVKCVHCDAPHISGIPVFCKVLNCVAFAVVILIPAFRRGSIDFTSAAAVFLPLAVSLLFSLVCKRS
ncbi:MAG TPA: hypothetical protein DE060_06050 [Lentisphaeria bacterium]|nr:hypothetical protein [Lentisphaeria bacterium]HCG48757.1 hypothetical protein [Lentisphaeria bacterium]